MLSHEIVTMMAYISRQLKPYTFYVWDIGLTAQFSLGANFQRDPRNLCSKCTEPDNHAVDGVLQIQDFATGVHIDLLGQVSQCDSFGDRGNASDLAGQIGGKFIDCSCQFAPSSFDVEDQSLTA